MFNTGEIATTKLTKRWLMTIGIFLLVQLIFFGIDGTALEPNINDSNNIVARTGRWILDSKLFTEWVTPYSYPFFNLATVVYILGLLIRAGQDMILTTRFKK